MKAWRVSNISYDEWERCEDVIWADTRAQAIRKSEAYMTNGDWINCRARRVPWLDGERRELTDADRDQLWPGWRNAIAWEY